DESQSDAASLNIFAQVADNAPSFTSAANNISSRPRLTVSVPWQPPPWNGGESNANERTPNVAGLIQEITSRPGWSSGNAIAFIITGAGHRTADAADKPGGSPPRL